MKDDTTALAAATHAIEQGYSPIPIPRGSKAPRLKGWTDLRYRSKDELTEAFTDGSNVGLLLGAPSGGLIDIDLDADHARVLADAFLPYTGMVHGRPGSPSSHRWYICDREISTKKYVEPSTGETLVELRSTGGQTVVPPSVHPSGETYTWEGDEAKPASVRRVVLKRAVRELASAALLARNWPGEGSRHDASVALAGGLMLSGWKASDAWKFMLEIMRAAGDEEAARRKGDVATTGRRILAGRKVQGWPTLATILGDRVVDTVRSWLELTVEEREEPDPDLDADDLRNRRLVGQAIVQGIPDPEMVVEGVLYAARITWWQGEPASGKTLLALKFIVDLVKEGASAMLVDEEAGLAMTAERMAAMGADPEALDERFFYYEFPGLTTDEEDLTALFRVVARERPALIVFDSCADLLRQAGIDEDDNIAVTGWVKDVLEPLANEYGAAVLVIDHVTKSRDSRGKWARGAGAKKAKAKAAWTVEKVNDFSYDPPTMGSVRLRLDKDTLGRLPRFHDLSVGTNTKGETIISSLKVTQPSNKVLNLDDSTLDRRLADWLQENAMGEERAVGIRKLAVELDAKTTNIKEALDQLVAANNGVRTLEDDTGYARYHYVLEQVIDFGMQT